jgi:hypothetical protein
MQSSNDHAQHNQNLRKKKKAMDGFDRQGDTSLAAAQRIKIKKEKEMPRVQFKFTSLEVEFEAEVEEVKHLMRIIKKKKQKQVQQWMERVDKSARRIQWNLSRLYRRRKSVRLTAAVSVQRLWRGYCARKKVKEMICKRNLEIMVQLLVAKAQEESERHSSAQIIQRSFRRYSLKRNIGMRIRVRLEREEQERILQEKMRRVQELEVKRRERKKQKVENIIKGWVQRRRETMDAIRRGVAANVLQCRMRYFLFRKRLKIRHNMADKIGRVFRLYLYKKKKKRLEKLESERWEKERAERERQEREQALAAVDIQKTFRGHVTRKALTRRRRELDTDSKIPRPSKLIRIGGGYMFPDR